MLFFAQGVNVLFYNGFDDFPITVVAFWVLPRWERLVSIGFYTVSEGYIGIAVFCLPS